MKSIYFRFRILADERKSEANMNKLHAHLICGYEIIVSVCSMLVKAY